MSRVHPLLLALLCLLGCVQLAQGQNFACNFKGQLGWYDLKPLKGSQISGTDNALPPQWLYFLNMCDVATGTSAAACTSLSPGAMVCQSYKQTPVGNTFAIAYPTDATKAHQWAEITSPFTGIQLTAYGVADTGCSNGYKVSVIQIQCDPTVTAVPASVTGSVLENPKCSYNLQFTHASACPSQNPPADDSGGGSSGLSGGSIFLIVALVGAFVYVAGGCFYKRYQKGTTGMIESCPNNEFWTAIPGLVKDGCMYTVRKIKSLCGGGGGSTSGGTGSYENI